MLSIALIIGLILIAVQAEIWSNWHASIIIKAKGKVKTVKTSVKDIIWRIIVWWTVAMLETLIEHRGFGGKIMEQIVVIDFFAFVIGNAIMFWIIFDPLINIKTGRKWNYVSIYNNKLLDAIFNGSVVFQYTIKAVFLVAFVIFSYIAI
jgi:hypothetical protein